MSTTTETTAASTAVKRKRKRFIVTLDGVPCARVRDRAFGHKLVPASGYFVKAPNEPTVFKGSASAHRAIGFTLRFRKRLNGAICDVPPAHREAVAPGVFKVERSPAHE